MAENLLVHSMSAFSSITLPILQAINANAIAEIGAEFGGHSKLLYEFLRSRGGKLTSVDCAPNQSFIDWAANSRDVVTHVAQPSLSVLSQLPKIDAWFIDGDHNWYTVYSELKLIREKCRRENTPFMVFLHDVAWPWARRDLYYAPERIPSEFLHEHTYEGGVTLDNPGVIEGGFRSNGAYAIATKEGGPRNGVLTAVEDFVKEYAGEFCLANIPAVFGLGVMFDFRHPQAEQIAAIVTPFNHNSLLKTLEETRLANYLKVIEWQDRETNRNTENQEAMDLEKTAVNLLNVIDAESSNPELWPYINQQLPAKGKKLKKFIDYLVLLQALPQDANTIKLISLLEAICFAKNGDLKAAHEKLEKLYSADSTCKLIPGAYALTFSLSDTKKVAETVE